MIELTVNCSLLHAKLTEEGCRKNQAIRECCLICDQRDPSIKYIGMLSELIIDRNVRGGKRATISKQGGAKRSLAEKTPIMAGAATLRVVASVTCKAPPPKPINCSAKKPFWRPKGFTRQNEVRNGWPKGKPRGMV